MYSRLSHGICQNQKNSRVQGNQNDDDTCPSSFSVRGVNPYRCVRVPILGLVVDYHCVFASVDLPEQVMRACPELRGD